MYNDIREASNTAEDFTTFVSLAVVSGLKSGDFLVYDNAAVLFSSETWEELSSLFDEYNIIIIPLSTYSPERNPIERCFGVVKYYLRYHQCTWSMLQEIIKGFGQLTLDVIEKQFLVSTNYFFTHPFPLHLLLTNKVIILIIIS